ncbi:MAG: DUF3466 family protein [Planctomycetes bacterium]|nr:DUF3466 family protein [Planctomycetota bacterium]
MRKSKSNLTGGKSKGHPLSIVTLLYLLFISNPTQAMVRYIAIDLGTVPGFSGAYAHSINNHGQIVGDVGGVTSHAVLFDPTGQGNNIDLGTLGGEDSLAASINDNGKIVGAVYNALNVSYAVLFDATGDGNNIALDVNSSATSINKEGQIVGAKYYIEDGNVLIRAAIFDLEGEGNTMFLSQLSGYRESGAFCINNRGQIVGVSANDWFSFADYRATLFDPNGVNNIDLGTLGGANSSALSINDSNQIVGSAEDANGHMLATLFDPTGEGNNVNLGTVEGYDIKSYAHSINNKGQIVGRCETGGFLPVAVLFDPTGAGNNIDLNNLINPALEFTLLRANCINDNGWIVGKFKRPGKVSRAFLLTPATPGDSEPDRDVDLEDYAVLTAAWRSTPADDNWNPFCDISEPEDGSINESDLAVFAVNYLMQSP